MSRQPIVHHYARLLTRWPKDRLRPQETQFQRLLEKRIQNAPPGAKNEMKEVNAAYLLLDNHFAKQHPLSEAIMMPESNPEHYSFLAKELDELPDRTWLGNFMNRMKNVVRFQ